MKLTLTIILIALCVIGTVSAENIYSPVPATTPSLTGHVWVTVRCHHNLFSREMILTSITNDGTEIVNITPDGKWDDELLTGDYGLILIDGNAGHPESTYFTIRPGESAYIPLIGHAVSSEPGVLPTQTPLPTDTITPEPTATISPTDTPTPEPTFTVEPTTTLTPVPTTIPTTSPTVSPTITPLPTPVCHKEKVCVPGYWEYEKKLVRCDNPRGGHDCCRWVIVPIWHPEKCHTITVCP